MYAPLTDSAAAADLMSWAFGGEPAHSATWMHRVAEVWGFTRHDDLVGVHGTYLTDIHFGRWIPVSAVAGVAVSLEGRGQGVGRAMMEAHLLDLHARSIPLAALFASTQVVYRRVGYEQAGVVIERTVPLSAVPAWPRTLRPVEVPLTSSLVDRYEAAAQRGNLRRDAELWRRATGSGIEGQKRLYLLGDRGYVLLHQQGDTVQVVDRATPDAQTLRGMWTLLRDMRSIVKHARWRSHPGDASLLLFDEQPTRVTDEERWMLRVVDVPGALAARSYSVDGVVEIEVDDPLVPANCGRWRLRIHDGQPTVERGGQGLLALSINALAPLFSGLLTADDLVRGGQASGSPQAPVFAGHTPWMAHRF